MTVSVKAPTSTTGSIQLNGSDVLTIDSSGNLTAPNDVSVTGDVGIGTSSPATKVHIQQSAVTSAPSRSAALYLENNSNCEIQFVGNPVNDCQLRFGTSSNSFKGAVEYQLDVDALLAYTNSIERMRIDSSGRAILGGTSWVGGSTDSGLQIDMNTSTDATYGFIIRNASNNAVFICKMNGSTYNTTGTYGTISDARLKENIVDATPKLDEVKQLKVRNFNFIGQEEKQLGFVAQEIEQIFPNIVSTQAERTHEEIDEEGNTITVTTPEQKSVKTTVLIPILTKAIQEQQVIIEDLKARIEALESA